jgi:hypothetical protein
LKKQKAIDAYPIKPAFAPTLDLDRQRVVAVGPVERDGGDRVGAVDEYDVLGHRSSSRMGRPSDRLRPRNSATTFSPHRTLTS